VNTLGAVDDHGFAVLPQLVSARDTDRLLSEIDLSSLRRSKAGVRHLMSHPAVRALAESSALMAVAREILGDAAIPYRATLFDKSSQANWLVVWHQDTALPMFERKEAPGWGPWSVKEDVIYAHAPASALQQILALRVHFDDSDEQNGPLRVLSGTHRYGVLNDDDIHDLVAKVPVTECLVPRGGVLAMRPLLIHASSKAQSINPRRVLHIEYSASKSFEGLEVAIA
jgi:ectoine hydroxylase-related dioxygenase (phytanoyl-CoA dioxygenase family)